METSVYPDLDKLEFVLRLNPAVAEVTFRTDQDDRLLVFVEPDFAYLKAQNGLKTSVMPNGLETAYTSEGEVNHFFDDIFLEQNYLKNHLTLQEGDLIFDIGANAGYFSLFVSTQLTDYTLFAFEPCPPLFDVLSYNALRHGLRVELINEGLSDRAGVADFTYYPYSSGYSTFHANTDEEKNLLKTIMLNQLHGKGALSDELLSQTQAICDFRFISQPYQCQLNTVSGVISANHIKVIDLLKVDAEKSELSILQGIDNEHWPIIKQIVIEVHNTDGQLAIIEDLLRKNHFKVTVERDPLYTDTVMYMVYGTNERFRALPKNGSAVTKYTRKSMQSTTNGLLSATVLRNYLAERLPEEMLQTDIFIVHSPNDPLIAEACSRKRCRCERCHNLCAANRSAVA